MKKTQININKLLGGKSIQGISIDKEARAIYFTVSDKEASRTQRVNEVLSIDYDKNDKLVGIEIIRISRMGVMIEKAMKDIRQALPQSALTVC